MSARREFDIAFVALKEGIHRFEYDITDKFFQDYDEQDFSEVDARIKLELEKQTGFFLLRFDIGGKLNVICDRCGNKLPLQLWDEFKLVVKLVDNPEELNNKEEDPDIYYLHRNESHLHLSDWIYEFINLSIPMTRMCNEEEIGGPHCNKEVLAKLAKMRPNDHNANSIWKDLDKFKNLDTSN